MMSKNKTGRIAGLMVMLNAELLKLIIIDSVDSGLVLKPDVISDKSNKLRISRFV